MYRLTNNISTTPPNGTVSRRGAVRWPILAAVVAGTVALGGTALSLTDFGQALVADSATSTAQHSPTLATAKVTPSSTKPTSATGTTSSAAGTVQASQLTPLQRAQAINDQKMAGLISALDEKMQKASSAQGQQHLASPGNESGNSPAAPATDAASTDAASTDAASIAKGLTAPSPNLTSDGRPIPVNKRPFLRRVEPRGRKPNSGGPTEEQKETRRLPNGNG